MAKLTLDGSVSLQRLQQFAQEAGDQSIRMKEEDGVKVLYTSDKNSTGVKNFFTGQSDRRRQEALVEIRTLLSEYQTKSGSTGAQIDGNILNLIPDNKITGGNLVNVVQTTLDDALMANQNLGLGAVAVHAFESKDPESMKSLVTLVTHTLDTKIENSDDPNAKRNSIALDDGCKNRNKILARMSEIEGGHVPNGTTYENASPELKKFVDEVYFKAVGDLTGHRLLDDNGNQLEFQGVRYIRVNEDNGRGAYGRVDIYRREDGEEQIAVKRPKYTSEKERQERFDEYVHEYREHARVGYDGDPNVVGLKGMMRGPDGDPLIVLEAAPCGDVDEVGKILHDSNGTDNAKTTVALTLLQDMAKGLNKVHEKGIVHVDVKGPNFLIGPNGKAQVADMGTSGGEVDVRNGVIGAKHAIDSNPIDNPIWQAPELLHRTNEVKGHERLIKAAVNARQDNAKAKWEAKGFEGEELNAILRNVKVTNEQKVRDELGERQIELTEKTDVWSFGMTAFQLLFGKELPDQFQGQTGFQSDIENAILEFAQNPNNRIFTANEGEQLTLEQEFINWIMHPDPDQRPSMQQILEHDIFKQIPVGSDLAYDVIKSLKSGDNLNDKLQALQGLTG